MTGKVKIFETGPIFSARVHFYLTLFFYVFFLSITAIAGARAGDPFLDRAESGAGVCIDVHQKARVKGETIRLGDIAEIRAAGGLAQQLRDVEVADAPKPGLDRTMSGKWVSKSIRAIKWLPDDALIHTPESVQVHRMSQTLSGDLLKSLLRNYVDSRIAGDTYTIKRVKVRGKTIFPLGLLKFDILNDDAERIGGRVKMFVMVYVDGEEYGRMSVSGWVDRYEMVACAQHALPRGSVLNKTDLVMKSVNTSKTPMDLIKLRDHAVGKRLKKTLKSGEYLRDNMLEAAPLIYKGDRVRLVAEGGGLSIVTNGLARGSGGKGEQIRVENISSKKIVVGRVRDRSTVEVLF